MTEGGSAHSDQIGTCDKEPPSACGISPARGAKRTYAKVSTRGEKKSYATVPVRGNDEGSDAYDKRPSLLRGACVDALQGQVRSGSDDWFAFFLTGFVFGCGLSGGFDLGGDEFGA